jgi:hypothetical protein
MRARVIKSRIPLYNAHEVNQWTFLNDLGHHMNDRENRVSGALTVEPDRG